MVMKKKFKKNYASALLLTVFSLSLFSFIKPSGGDSFEIYLNNSLIVQQYVVQMKSVKKVSLNQSDYNGEIEIVYSHCGQTGKERKVMIKDAQNRILKQWSFADVSGAGNKTMNCKAKEIMELQKNNNGGSLSLYYSSKELPGGKLLADIVVVKNSTAKS